MSAYEIYIDASVDVPASILEEGNVHIVPMHYTADGAERIMERPMTEEDMKPFYDEMRQGIVFKTSQITPFHYIECFTEDIESGKGILYLSLSSGLSNTYSSSENAKQTLQEDHPGAEIEVVDTLSATGGMAVLLLQAIRNRESGMSLADNAAFLRAHALDVAVWFVVDELSYLRRGGRIPATTAFVGSMLNIKPLLKIGDDGKLLSASKQRGIVKALKFMVSLYEKGFSKELPNDVFICHADDIERAEKLRDLVLEVNPEAKIHIAAIGPIVGAHTGPGMTCICYYGDRHTV